jgi:hypothetical protein
METTTTTTQLFEVNFDILADGQHQYSLLEHRSQNLIKSWIFDEEDQEAENQAQKDLDGFFAGIPAWGVVDQDGNRLDVNDC